ncbi:MAG: TonB-dependent receptor [Verrucomicrobiaceae bacterium]|nr:TonB-dependent receptor [Verrucomicrobiaceae bacterium]
MRPASHSLEQARCLLVVLSCLLLASGLRAQDAGGLRGTVTDADFFAPVQGAQVTLTEIGLSARTDESGRFFINSVPAGAHSVAITREGYVRQIEEGVVISSGGIKEIEVTLTGVVVELDEFVVPALDEEETDLASSDPVTFSANLKSLTTVLGRNFFTQTGASDVGKALTKATGVNVVDGKFVVVRGLNDRYNAVSLNNARIPSSDPDRRAVPLDLFPSSIVENISTSKTFLPYMPGEATGGNIVITTRAVPKEPKYSFKFGTGYNTQATGNNNFLSYQGGGTGDFGTAQQRALPQQVRNATGDAPAGQEPFTRINEIAPRNGGTPEQLENRRLIARSFAGSTFGTEKKSAPLDTSYEMYFAQPLEFMGMPAGITVALDYFKKYTYNPADFIQRMDYASVGGQAVPIGPQRFASVQRGTESMRASALVSLGLELPDNGRLGFTYFFNRLADDTASYQLGGDSGGNVTERESIFYSERQLATYQLYGTHFPGEEKGARIDWVLSYNQTHQLDPDQRFFETFYDPGSNSNVTNQFRPFTRLWREVYDTSYNANLDISVPIHVVGDKTSVVRFGGAFDVSNRRYRGDRFEYDPVTFDDGGFYDGNLNPGRTYADEFLGANPNHEVYQANPPEIYRAEQTIAAGFGMLDIWPTEHFNLSFGGRIESTDIRVRGTPVYVFDINQNPEAFEGLRGDVTPQEWQAAFNGAAPSTRLLNRSRATIQRVDFLPALNLSYEFSPGWTWRGAVSRTVARPSFKELAPVLFVNPETNDFFVGNVDLRMSSIMNYDTRVEWRGDDGATAGISFFAKHIRDAIELSNGLVQKYQNAPEAIVYGFELETQTPLSFIAPELKNFNVGLNYSFIRSNATLPANQVTFSRSRRLQGQPDYIFNANLTYDNKDTGWFAGLFFNVTGPMLALAGAGPTFPDVLQYPVATLDFGLAYQITKRGKITFRANNLLNPTIERRYITQDRSLFSSTTRGVNFSLGMTLEW